MIEGLVAEMFQKCLGMTSPLPLPRLNYAEAMRSYGSDKPDLRFGMEIVDIERPGGETEFSRLPGRVAAGGKVRGLNAKGAAEKFSRKDLDELTESCSSSGPRGWPGESRGGQVRLADREVPAAAVQQDARSASPPDRRPPAVRPADKEEVVCQALVRCGRNGGEARTGRSGEEGIQDRLGARFPVVHLGRRGERWAANHHPFTAPRDEDLDKLETDPARAAKAYDLVINGYEVGGGSIRIHNPEVQSRLFAVLGMTRSRRGSGSASCSTR